MAFNFDLTKLDETYQKAEVKSDEYEKIPDGKYHVIVDKVELSETKKGQPKLAWQLKITSGLFEGRKLFRNNLLVSASNIEWLKSDLHKAGLDLEKLSDLPNHLADLLDVALEVTVKSSGENTNVYLGKRIVTDAEKDARASLTDELDLY